MMNDEGSGKGRLERLEEQVQSNLAESNDYMFSDYLRKMNQRVIEQRHQIDLLQDELDRNCRAYQQKQSAQELPRVTESADYQQLDFNQEQHEATKEAIRQAWEQSGQHKKNAEFTIGATVLSLVGGAFILTALVMLGMTFMNDVVKAIGMYAVSLAVLLVAELLVYKKVPKLGAVLSGIGIGGLYTTTMLCYGQLWLWGEGVTIAVVMAITVGAFLLNRKRESAVLRVFTQIACYVCFLLLQEAMVDFAYIIWSVALLAVNVLCIVLPVKKNRDLSDKIQMGVNTFFYFLADVSAVDYVAGEYLVAMLFTSFLIIQILFTLLVKRNEKAGQKTGVSTFVVYWICNFLHLGMASVTLEAVYDNPYILHGNTIAIALVCVVLSCILWKSVHKWHFYLYVAAYVVFPYGLADELMLPVTLLIVCLVTKLLALKNVKSLRVMDLILTLPVCTRLIVGADDTWMWAYFAAVLLSILLMNHWQTFYEILLVGTLLVFAHQHLLFGLRIPVLIGILLVALLLFNYVPRWRDKNIALFNALALAVQIVCHLTLLLPIYHKEYFTYLCALIGGVATIFLVLEEHFHMSLKGRNICLAIYLTYMALIFEWEWPIINSIFMMFIALVCVGVGFANRHKAIRIYGLVLSLLICGKIALYDFLGAATIQKIVLFFAVGIIAGIYILLEKRTR